MWFAVSREALLQAGGTPQLAAHEALTASRLFQTGGVPQAMGFTCTLPRLGWALTRPRLKGMRPGRREPASALPRQRAACQPG